MSEQASPISEHVQQLAEATAGLGISFVRSRDFMGRKVARDFMEETGCIFPGDDEGNAFVEYVLGTCVSTGITLSLRSETTEIDIDEQVARLSAQMPEAARKSFGALIGPMIEMGITFHGDEMRRGSGRVTEWTAEFQQLHNADPRHELWGE